MPALPLFVFGTLRRGECNHHYLEDGYDRVLPARLPGFARVELLMIARQDGADVQGELFFLKPATADVVLSGCDRLEELTPGSLVGHEYRRIAVRVQTEVGEFVAWAYARPDADSEADLQPLIAAESQRLASLSRRLP